MERNGGHRVVAFVNFHRVLGGGNPQFVSVLSIQSDAELGKTPPLGRAVNARAEADAGIGGRTEQGAKVVQRRAGQFQVFVAFALLDRKLAVQDEKFFLRTWPTCGFLEIRFVEDFGGAVRTGLGTSNTENGKSTVLAITKHSLFMFTSRILSRW